MSIEPLDSKCSLNRDGTGRGRNAHRYDALEMGMPWREKSILFGLMQPLENENGWQLHGPRAVRGKGYELVSQW